MIVTFASQKTISLEATMQFERTYEPELQLDEAEKSAIARDGIFAYMLVDGKLAGECYGIDPALLDEEIEDIRPGVDPIVERELAVYCYSTTILPEFKGRGLAKILVAYWNGLCRGDGFTKVYGHATSPAMVAVRTFFGAKFLATHECWYGTERTARFYVQPL